MKYSKILYVLALIKSLILLPAKMLETLNAKYEPYKQMVLRNHPFLANHSAEASNGALDVVIAIAIGIFAVAYILPPAMTALGGANTTDWPTGTSAFIPVIGIFVMIALLIYFSKPKG